MKIIKSILIFLYFTLSWSLQAQTLIQKKYYSQFVKDSIPVKIWLPNDYSPKKKYPVFYEFVYDHSNYLAATLDNYYETPSCIVVNPYFEDAGNAHYSDETLNETGKGYYKFLINELIPSIEKQYHTTSYRVAVGLSQGADYANYILRNNPELFKAWLIFSIEKPNYKPYFPNYTKNIKHPIDYFIAVPESDEPYRISFAHSLDSALRTNKNFNIKLKEYPTNHTYSILYAFPDALKFIFDNYINLRLAKENEDFITYYNSLKKEMTDKYGLEPNFDNFLSNMMNKLSQEKDTTMVNSIVDSLALKSSQLQLFNMTYYLIKSGNLSKSKEILLKSEAMTPKKKADIQLNPVMIYRTLALNIYDKQGKYEKAFETLVKGHERIKNLDIGLLYYIGSYSLNRNIHLKEGIQALKEVLTERDQSTISVYFKDDFINTEIAEAYLKLKDKKEAKIYAEKALKINSKNIEAKSILEKL